jgi:hypothetical protein
MDEILILIICDSCGEEHYFQIDSLPNGLEHCEYCEFCGSRLPELSLGKADA